MSVRLSPRGSHLITYDPQSKEWVSIGGAEICILSERVEIEPGTTLADIFRVVERYPDLKKLLADYCYCNIDLLHGRPRVGDDLIEIATKFEESDAGKIKIIETRIADTLSITSNLLICCDKEREEQIVEFDNHFLVSDMNHLDCGIPVHQVDLNLHFKMLCELEVRIDESIGVTRWNDEKKDGQDDWLRDAKRRFTLLDVLEIIYSAFGERCFDSRTPIQVEEDDEAFRLLRDPEFRRRLFGDGKGSPDGKIEPDK